MSQTLTLNKAPEKAASEATPLPPTPQIIVPSKDEVIELAKPSRESAVKEIVSPFKGRGMEMIFDDHGSVTFKKGKVMESIHMSSTDRLIYKTAERVCR